MTLWDHSKTLTSTSTMVEQAASLYERAVNTEETAERHDRLAEALVLAERKDQALWHFRRAADLYDDRQDKASLPPWPRRQLGVAMCSFSRGCTLSTIR